MSKADPGDFERRFREILADPNNKLIPRVAEAGKIEDGFLTMHNGLQVAMGDYAYYGAFAQILEINGGVHEPQEELVFTEVLKYIPEGGTIVELGAYWAFYSMWFLQAVSHSKAFCVEPDEHNLMAGRTNSEHNGLPIDFTQAAVGDSGIKLDDFVEEKGIDFIDILHADVQGAEIEMLAGAQKTIASGNIGYVFLGTHSQQLHLDCTDFLTSNGFTVIASADYDNETFSFDGILIARYSTLAGLQPMDVGSRVAEEARPGQEEDRPRSE
ncbi:MAG: FkbM family methyltransferase [Coriobacteriia bacterium]|nr:FkbM family methyltransferase [Coriobacteriia bacterium]